MFNFKANKLKEGFLKKAIILFIFFSFGILSAFSVNYVAEAAEESEETENDENDEQKILWQEDKITLKIDENKRLEKIVDTTKYTDLKWQFAYDSRELDASATDYFVYGWFYLDESDELIEERFEVAGLANKTDEEVGEVSVTLPEEIKVSELTVFIEVFGNTASDDVKISNLILEGNLVDSGSENEEEEAGTEDGNDNNDEGNTGEENTSEEEGTGEEDGTDEGDENSNNNDDEGAENNENDETPNQETEVLWEIASLNLNKDKPLTKVVDATNFTNLKWEFTFDSTELEEKNSASSSVSTDYFVYGWFFTDENGELVRVENQFLGKTGATDAEKGLATSSLPENASVEELNFFVEVFADATSSDRVKISNLTLTGTKLADGAEGDENQNTDEGNTGEEEGTGEEDGTDEGDGTENGDENNDNSDEENTDEEGDDATEEGEGDENSGDESNGEDENSDTEEDENSDEENTDDENSEEGDDEQNEEEEVEETDPDLSTVRDVTSYRLTRDVTSYRTTYEERVANRY